jgi:hypothetical protein
MKSEPPFGTEEKSSTKVEIPLSRESIEYLKTKERTKIYTIIPLAQTYLEVLDDLRSSWAVSDERTPKPSSLIPFVVTAAAALECLLNDNLIMHCQYVFGLNPNDKFANAFLSMSLRGKLETIIPLLTNNKYVIRRDSPIYRQLNRLVKLRNDLMHGKSFLKEHDVSIEHSESGGFGFSIKLPKMAYQEIGQKDCFTFLRALQELDNLLSSHSKWQDEEGIPAEFQGILGKLPPR